MKRQEAVLVSDSSRSGMGREGGVEGLEEFLDTRTLAVRLPA